MLFVLTAIDRENATAVRLANRDAHFAFIRDTAVARLGGPFLSPDGRMIGSMIVFEAHDLAAAQAWAAEDPYRKAGLFAQVDIRPWKATFNACGAAL